VRNRVDKTCFDEILFDSELNIKVLWYMMTQNYVNLIRFIIIKINFYF